MKTWLIILIILISISCKQNETSKQQQSPDGVGVYNGIISTTINKTPSHSSPSSLSPITENSSELMTVNLSKNNGVYFLDGNTMSGGPTTFKCSNSKGNFIFNLQELNIIYSFSNNRQEWIKIGGGNFQFDVNENRSGTLK